MPALDFIYTRALSGAGAHPISLNHCPATLPCPAGHCSTGGMKINVVTSGKCAQPAPSPKRAPAPAPIPPTTSKTYTINWTFNATPKTIQAAWCAAVMRALMIACWL